MAIRARTCEGFVHFLDPFATMKRGYEAKALEYQLIISRKPETRLH